MNKFLAFVIWDKVFKNGRQPLWKTAFKFCLSRPYPFKFFKGCLPQILLGPFLNTWTHLLLFTLKFIQNFSLTSAHHRTNELDVLCQYDQ